MTFEQADERFGDPRRFLRRRWTTALIVLVWAQGIVPPTIRSLTSSKEQLSLTTVSVASTNGLVARADQFLTYGEIVCALAILVIFGRDARGRSVGVILGLLPWGYLVARDAYDGSLVSKRQLAYPLVFLAIWALRPVMRDLQALGYLVTATALLSIVMGFAVPAAGILQTDATTAVEDKQIFSQGILLGPFNQGNQLGSYLVVGVASLAMIRNRQWRWLSIALITYALLWSSARSSLATFAVLALTVFVLNAVGRRARLAVGSVVITAVAVIVCATPILTHAPGAFTNRGFIWTQVFKAWNANHIFGLGTNWFAKTAASSGAIANSAYDAHNQFLQLLTTGGIALTVMVGLLLTAATVAAASRARSGELFGFYLMVVLLGAGWLEASFGFTDRNQLMAVAIVPLAFLLFAAPPELPSADIEDPVEFEYPTGRPISLPEPLLPAGVTG